MSETDWIQVAIDKAETRLRSIPYSLLGPAGRLLLQSLDIDKEITHE
jgi:hypothetical protein